MRCETSLLGSFISLKVMTSLCMGNQNEAPSTNAVDAVHSEGSGASLFTDFQLRIGSEFLPESDQKTHGTLFQCGLRPTLELCEPAPLRAIHTLLSPKSHMCKSDLSGLVY